jgi:NADPH-dependent ferric siderophore reductase
MTTDTSPTPEGAEVPPPRRRRVMRRVRVTRVEQLSPRMVRVTFTGDDLGACAWSCTPDCANARQAIVTRQANAGAVGANERFTP